MCTTYYVFAVYVYDKAFLTAANDQIQFLVISYAWSIAFDTVIPDENLLYLSNLWPYSRVTAQLYRVLL